MPDEDAAQEKLREAIEQHVREVHDDPNLIVTEYALAVGSTLLQSARQNHVSTEGYGSAYATLGLAHMLVHDLEDPEGDDDDL